MLASTDGEPGEEEQHGVCLSSVEQVLVLILHSLLKYRLLHYNKCNAATIVQQLTVYVQAAYRGGAKL